MTKGRPTTIFEVAHAAGVSLGTASKAMNGNGRISLATRERVLQAAKTLGFRPNPIARGLITGRSSTVGMIMVDSMTHRIALPIMLGAESALAEIELSMISADARGDVERGIALAHTLAARKVDGILIVGDNNARTRSISQLVDLPVVYVYGESTDETDVVHMPDDRQGAGLAVEHLVNSGRRKLLHVTGPRRATAVAQRVKGLQAHLRGHDLRLLAPTCYGAWSQRWARSAALEIITAFPDVDGIVCGSDQIASGVVTAIADLGRRIPDDIAVTGYDNWAVFAEETEPALTTIDMCLEDLGASAARELFAIIDGNARPSGLIYHACELVIRGSAP